MFVEYNSARSVQSLLQGRVLLSVSEENCTKPAFEEFPGDVFTLEERRNGAILLHFLLACYSFVLLAFVCDDYFVPSIRTLCERLDLSADVAGATFMATATSAPELFVNIVGTFVTKGDLGIGTIVGSAVFNILAVPACCGLLGGKSIKMDSWPLTRDCFVYGVTVTLLIVFLRNDYIDWSESLALVVLYIIYLIVLYYNDSLSSFVKRLVRKRKMYKKVNYKNEKTALLQFRNAAASEWSLKVQVEEATPPQGYDTYLTWTQSDAEALQTVPEGFWSTCFFVISWPISFVLFLTIPDCRQEKKQRLWPVTFLMCMVWIAGTSYVVSWLITTMGHTLAIPDSVMGLTFLAAGMSVPEATTSVIVTNQGHGEMGISSSIGSNTFDVLLCLGLPWLIKSTFLPNEPGHHVVKINSQGLGYTAISLLMTLAILYVSFVLNRFVLDRKIGLICLLMYLIFLIFACLMELNVFFPVNLPTCGS
ncbi:hypothetical protein RUM43_008232 [Polyplax serrata]|uniref:Sodium/calcium exchanger membrane region domain-containing protein n=1 Tax=Polyplax serrata TaxID=468196 RepID=A0AAN8P6R7_POLSC